MRDPLEFEMESQRGMEEVTKHYQLHELAEMLDTDPGNVQHWLDEDGIKPVSADKPDHYAAEVLERLRARVQGKSSGGG